MHKKWIYLFISLATLGLDQITKEMVNQSLFLHESRSIIPGFFNLVHTRNSGAVFGVFQDSTSAMLPKLLLMLSFAALGLVGFYFLKSPLTERLNLMGLSLIMGGAVGNIIDRLARSSVVDFLEFYVGSFHWPAFNVADSAICVGISFLLLRAFRDREDPAEATQSAARLHS